MVEINLYKPGQVDATIPFPSEWSELLLEELHLFSNMMLSSFSNPGSVRGGILAGIINIRSQKEKIKLPKNWFDQLDMEDTVLQGYPALDFLFKENTLINQPYSKISLPRLFSPTVYGPLDAFDNLTCGEFEDSEIFFYQFAENPGPDPLAHLAAILYRPKNIPYIRFVKNKKVEYNVERMIRYFIKLPADNLYTIYCWYVGCRNQLPKLFPTAFEGDGSKSDQPDFIAFTKCIHAGAGPKNGTRDQIRMMLMKEYFLDMELEAIKAKELKAKLERNGK